jgi:quinol monooxygenase YgiN
VRADSLLPNQLERAMARSEAVIRVDEMVTFVNVLEVEPEKQQALLDVMNESAEKVIKHRPGFISVSILASQDGSRVVSYAQWRSPDDIKATRDDPRAQEYAKRTAELAKASPHVYSVVSVLKPAVSY